MTPEESRMIESEKTMTHAQLLTVILTLKKRIAEDNAYQIENSRVLTEMAKDYQKLQAERDSLYAENVKLKAALLHTAQINQLRANDMFGRGTEKLSDVIDACPIEDEVDEATEVPSIDVASPKVSDGTSRPSKLGATKDRKTGHKRLGKRAMDYSKLPQQHVYQLDVDLLNQMYGEGNWRIAFWHPHQTLECDPSPVYVRTVYTPAISVGLEHSLITMPYEAPLWQHSPVSPSLAASIFYMKYCLALPLNRQEKMYADFGVNISKQTMSNWELHLCDEFFAPIYNHFSLKMMDEPYHQCDESTILVNKDGRRAGRKSYMWVHTTSELAETEPIVVFCFEMTRETEHLRKFFRDFKGYISCDAYCSYQVFAKENAGVIYICGCMMHMRRRFVESLSLIDKSAMDDDSIAQLPETKALILIGKIYDADESLKGLHADERQARRIKEVQPLVESFFSYVESLDTSDPLMGERLKDAINYSLNQKEYLCRFLTDGHIPIDNGYVERIIRKLAIGRRNFLFCDSVKGASALAIMYSIVETARANHANIYWYLRYVLESMPHDADHLEDSFLETVMPWSDSYREYERQRLSQGPPELRENEFKERPRAPKKSERHRTYCSA